MLNLNSELLLKVSNISIKAGIKIMEYYLVDTDVKIKEDRSPLTKADLAANDIIINELKLLDETIPILSEESLVDWSERKKWDAYWLVDPLDGTKEFINKNGEFTVNIALIKNNTPVLGVIYSPVLSTLYYAQKHKGSFKIISSKLMPTLDKSQKIYSNIKNKSDHILVIGSRSHSNDAFSTWIKNNFNEYEIIKKGSSLKFCQIAEGKADIYPRFGLTSEWDIAAGHIILEEAGGNVYTIDNRKITYNMKENILNPEFFASCKFID